MMQDNTIIRKNQGFPHSLLKEWFLKNLRSFPWREDPTPYKVWISEVMLQQTQASVVIPYFEKWIKAFPTIEALANATEVQVLKAWEGLGYYSRARNLHEAAKYMMEHCAGNLPITGEALSKIKGIGPYTKGAILSFAFKQKAAAVDGNVMRVLSRFYAIEEEIDQPRVQKRIWELADACLPDHEPWHITEGLIELGALVCTKTPQCRACPLKNECLAWKRGLHDVLPKKKMRTTQTLLLRMVAVVFFENFYLIKFNQKGIMKGLYEFPYLEEQEQDERPLSLQFETLLDIPLKFVKKLPKEQHTFTRFKAHLFPFVFKATCKNEKHLWVAEEEMKQLPFSSGHKRILERYFL